MHNASPQNRQTILNDLRLALRQVTPSSGG
jgi:hypothetical protein